MGLSQRRATASQHSRSKTKPIAPAAIVTASTLPFCRSPFMHVILPTAKSRSEVDRQSDIDVTGTSSGGIGSRRVVVNDHPLVVNQSKDEREVAPHGRFLAHQLPSPEDERCGIAERCDF
jgi:hypothetical protein